MSTQHTPGPWRTEVSFLNSICSLSEVTAMTTKTDWKDIVDGLHERAAAHMLQLLEMKLANGGAK